MDTGTTKTNKKIVVLKRNKVAKKGKQKKSKSMPEAVYLCGTCTKEIYSHANSFEENSIKCEFCNRWFHFGCVNIKEENDIPDEADDWICNSCDICFKIQ